MDAEPLVEGRYCDRDMLLGGEKTCSDVIDQLVAEVQRLSVRQLTLYDVAGEEVFTMTIGPYGCRWTAAEKKPIDTPVARIEIS